MAIEVRDRIKEFRRVKASELKANPKNWREHPKSQVDGLKAVLGEIGMAAAAIAYEENGQLVLIDGHMRQSLDPNLEWPVLVLDVTAAEADVLLATLDPLAVMAKTAKDKLSELLASMPKVDVPDLTNLYATVAAKFGAKMPGKPGLTDPDDVPATPTEAITKRGEVWSLGDHRLMCGDSTSSTDVLKLLDGTVPFIMVTDPPYGVNYDPKWRHRAGINKSKRTGEVKNDDQCNWLPAWKLFPGVVAYVWHGGLHSSEVASDLMKADIELRAQIIWVKPSLVVGRGAYHWKHEPCWYGTRGAAKWVGDRTQSTVWDIPNMHRTHGSVDDGETEHGTQKPVECMARPIRNHGKTDDAVYDPFVGSGTTLIAAEQLGRRSFSMEIDPIYATVAIRRWERFTGKTAVLVDELGA